MLNLLSNAVKFTPAGGRITVRARAVGALRSLITIEDNGIGIPKEALKKLGRPFEQVENQFTKSHRAPASASPSRARWPSCMAARMRIRSTLGKGTIVLLRLPADTRAPEKDHITEAA